MEHPFLDLVEELRNLWLRLTLASLCSILKHICELLRLELTRKARMGMVLIKVGVASKILHVLCA